MKNSKNIIVGIVILIFIIAIICFVILKKPSNEKTARLEFMVYDSLEKNETLQDTKIIKINDIVSLGEDNNITILEINNDNIKISREITKYKVINEEERKTETYKESIVETIEYGGRIVIDANEKDPFAPLDAPRYDSYIKVEKEK